MDISFPKWINGSPLLLEMGYTIDEFYPEIPPKYQEYLQKESIDDPTMLVELLDYFQFEIIPYELLPRMVNVNILMPSQHLEYRRRYNYVKIS